MGRRSITTVTRGQFKSPDNIIAEAIRKARQDAGLVHYQPRSKADDATTDR